MNCSVATLLLVNLACLRLLGGLILPRIRRFGNFKKFSFNFVYEITMKHLPNLLLCCYLLFAVSCKQDQDFPCSSIEEKATGISYYADYSYNMNPTTNLEVDHISANYLTFVMQIHGFSYSSHLEYDWWKCENELQLSIQKTREAGCKVMLKPHIDFDRYQTFRGDFTLPHPGQWRDFEENYRDMILTLAAFAEKNEAELLCFGTELSLSIIERPHFWETLISEIRAIYTGELVYAANWDNYRNITFWDQCDYIGIDSYFPLSKTYTPSVEELNEAWKPIKENIFELSQRHCKPILFTEYGYRSIDQAAWKGWMAQSPSVNYEAQKNAFESFYQTFWNEEWVAGGFIWEWYMRPPNVNNTNWSPQGKPAEEVIIDWYNR